MIVTMAPKDARTQPSRATAHCLRLKIARIHRDDAWEMYRLVTYYGGVEFRESCFAFPSEEQWRRALTAIQIGFGAEYVEIIDRDEAGATRWLPNKPR